ncbi:MAG: peptidoglycan bridge formation glycyltransferase FemA/FemB family protein [Bacilli bacterium]|nr:peptidoglycan bridge formation glycyltransferase FemA/FemB family protein [Bacilli bacterium]
MKFITDIDIEKYEDFVSSNKEKSHFLQSSFWGNFSQKEKRMIPHYVGITDDNDKLLASALLLEKKLPLGFSYFYSPRGYVMDFNDDKLLSFFTNNIKTFVKNKKGIFIKIDPDLIINKWDKDDNHIDLDNDYKKIFDNLIFLGYKHKGFTKNFETNQPRYTFRIDFSNKTAEEILDNFSKTTKQRIKKAKDLNVNVFIGDESNIHDFYKLMEITENRKDFVSHNEEYYKVLYDILKKEDKCNIFLGEVNIKEIIDKYLLEVKDIDLELEDLSKELNLSKTKNTRKKEIEKRKEKLLTDISNYKNLSTEYGDRIITNAHFIVEYGDKAWVLYAGNHNILTEVCGNYLTYSNHIEYYKNKGIKIYDQFGTIGDLNNKELFGLHDFKKKFGGDYIEFIGEFDLITNKFMYFVFVNLIPFYRNMVKKIAKRRKIK